MPFIEWDERFVTGVGQFDEHHQHLVGLLNKTYDDFICGAPEENFGVVLDELVDYAIYHFAAEETWMLDFSYPKLGEHKNEHESFFQKIMALQDEFHSGKVSISLEVLTYLKRWLKNHILVSDADYGRFIASKLSS